MNAVEFDKVSIVFGDSPFAALPLMDQGLSRGEIQEKTGQVLGVHDCSVTVGEGEILVLMGLSGSGKSTLLRGVNALNPVVRGEVRVRAGGEMVSVTHANPETLRGLRLSTIAMVFQQFGLLPWRTVRENVGLGLELAGQTPAQRREQVDRQDPRLNSSQASAWPSNSKASPMKPATKALVGRSYSSCGVPACAIRPWSMTTIWSLTASASAWSWVT